MSSLSEDDRVTLARIREEIRAEAEERDIESRHNQLSMDLLFPEPEKMWCDQCIDDFALWPCSKCMELRDAK